MECHCVKVLDDSKKYPDLEAFINKLSLESKGSFFVATGKDIKGNTCASCQGTGYNGTIDIFEILQLSGKFKELVASGTSINELKKRAYTKGFKSMLHVGLEKVAAQETTLSQLSSRLKYSSH